MSPIDKGYLARPHKPVSVRDLVVLLYNVYRGADDEEIGHEHATVTLERFTRYLGRHIVMIDKLAIESALWSCNLLDEKKNFWHPQGKTFDEFIAQAWPDNGFDRQQNLFTYPRKKARTE